MNKKLLFKIFLSAVLLILQTSFVSSQDTVKVIEADTALAIEPKPVNFEDSFLEQALKIFTSEPKIDSSDINNFVIQDFSDYLKVFRQLEILSYGPVSQTKFLGFLGIPGERVGIFYDDNAYSVQSLYIPQSGDVELQVLPFENIESVQIIGSSLANLIKPGGYSAGLFLKQKDYISGGPFSKLQFDQGMKGYRRAQVELGRPLFHNRLRFYLTAGFKKYSGDGDNTDQNLDNFTGKLTYDLSSNSKLVLNGSYYEGKRGVRGYPGWEILGIRKDDKVSNWSLDYYRKILQNKTFKFKLGYNYSFQNLKPMDWDLKNQAGLIKAEVYPDSLSKFSWKLGADFKYDRMKEFERHQRWRGNFNIGTLWQIAPNLNHLAWLNFVKTQSFKADVTGLTGFSWKPDPKWKIFAVGSRNLFYPTLFDLNFTKHEWLPYFTVIGNQNLSLAKYYSVNAGISYELKNLQVGTSVQYDRAKTFYNWTSKKVFDGFGNVIGFNSSSVVNDSLEKLGGFNLFVIHKLVQNFMYHLSVNLKEGFDSPKFTPKNSGYLYLYFNQNLFKNILHLKITLENDFIDDRNDDQNKLLEEAIIMHGKAGLKIKDFFIFYTLENITNQTYRTFGDFNMPKRSNFWGVSWEFRD